MVTAAQPQSASACRSRQLARQAHCALTSGVTEAKGTRRIDMKLNVLRGRDRDRNHISEGEVLGSGVGGGLLSFEPRAVICIQKLKLNYFGKRTWFRRAIRERRRVIRGQGEGC